MTIINVAAAVALYYALARFFPTPCPSPRRWPLGADRQPQLADHCVAGQPGGGVRAVLLRRRHAAVQGRWLLALLAFAASTLAYEFTIPICLVAAVLVGTPWLRPARACPSCGRSGPGSGGHGGGPARHRVVDREAPEVPVAWRPPDVWDTWSAHVSTGLLGTESAPTLLLRPRTGRGGRPRGCAVLWYRGDRGRDRGPALALAGAAVMALGLVTTIVLPGLTIGLSNRLYGAPSVGTAMVLAGPVLTVWRRRRPWRWRWPPLVVLCVIGQVVVLRPPTGAARTSWPCCGTCRRSPTTWRTPASSSRPPRARRLLPRSTTSSAPIPTSHVPGGDGGLRLATDPDELEAPEPGEVPITWEEVLGEAP